MAKSVGVEIPDELRDKNEAASLITQFGKDDKDLITLTLEYAKKGLWDGDYFQKAKEALNIPLRKTMNLEVNDDGELVSFETFGIRSKNIAETDNFDYHIFLSHSHLDLDMVKVFAEELKLYGFKVFVAHSDIRVSDEWLKVIEKELNSCKIFIAFLTANFKESNWFANNKKGYNRIPPRDRFQWQKLWFTRHYSISWILRVSSVNIQSRHLSNAEWDIYR